MILKQHGSIVEDGDKLMHGIVVNARTILHFVRRDIHELNAAFADTIDDYRDWCKVRGVEPAKAS